jgi:acetyltransferase-like isoleucine patch superfamily enzyme
MRRVHHPYWVEKLMERVNTWQSRHFLHPQFDSLGAEPRFTFPAHIHLIGGHVRAGDHFHVYATREQPVSFAVDPFEGGTGQIEIGDYCIFAPGVRIRSAISVRIGDNCMLAENTLVTDADWHDHYHRIYPGKREPVVLEDNVWVGDGATICKGVTIGENSIVGAASVVTRDIPKNTIAAGNPARPVGDLDPTQPTTRRDALFVHGMPYQQFKDEFDAKRLQGNTLVGWLRARAWPGRRS